MMAGGGDEILQIGLPVGVGSAFLQRTDSASEPLTRLLPPLP